jgi:antibiotic biosynthesis monooxygenase (ABM) superfamily enzyme
MVVGAKPMERAMEHPEIHVAILRTVRPGREAEFEAATAQMLKEAETIPGAGHAHIVRPAAGSGSRDYGFIRTFATAADRDAFYDSDFYRGWDERLREFGEGEAKRRPLHGLEAFFREGGGAPPKWKMALITWLGVTPLVYLYSLAVRTFLAGVPTLLQLCVVTALVVATLAWVVMPLLVRLFARWLRP